MHYLAVHLWTCMVMVYVSAVIQIVTWFNIHNTILQVKVDNLQLFIEGNKLLGNCYSSSLDPLTLSDPTPLLLIILQGIISLVSKSVDLTSFISQSYKEVGRHTCSFSCGIQYKERHSKQIWSIGVHHLPSTCTRQLYGQGIDKVDNAFVMAIHPAVRNHRGIFFNSLQGWVCVSVATAATPVPSYGALQPTRVTRS
jgi:hypothetical protein